MKYPAHLRKLVTVLRKLPGVGSRSAERFAFQMLGWKAEALEEMAALIRGIPVQLKSCVDCGCLMENRCLFCHDQTRDRSQLCIVVSQREVFSLEEMGYYRGIYHVLGTLFSPLEGKRIEPGVIDRLRGRIEALGVNEVIIAIDSTLEGDATALFLKDSLQGFSLKISRLAFGLPVGSALEFVDGGTLAQALKGRLVY